MALCGVQGIESVGSAHAALAQLESLQRAAGSLQALQPAAAAEAPGPGALEEAAAAAEDAALAAVRPRAASAPGTAARVGRVTVGALPLPLLEGQEGEEGQGHSAMRSAVRWNSACGADELSQQAGQQLQVEAAAQSRCAAPTSAAPAGFLGMPPAQGGEQPAAWEAEAAVPAPVCADTQQQAPLSPSSPFAPSPSPRGQLAGVLARNKATIQVGMPQACG